MSSPLPPGPSCPIGWQPSALAPVFYGYREYSTADGAPLTVRVYFPSLDGSPSDAAPLLGCGRYPLVLFFHGSCPGEANQYHKWFVLPAQLARAGYVVAIPQIAGIDLLPSEAPDVQAQLRDLHDWMRAGWELLYYRDSTRDGTGDVNSPSTIGDGGWQLFSQLSYGGNAGGSKILYAVVGQ
jgi:hypothetical protein